MGRNKAEYEALAKRHSFGIPVEFITDVVAVRVEHIKDKKYRFETVGSIANVINGNNRIIPMTVQRDAVEEWKKERWQLTTYIEHPLGDIRGSLKDLAGRCEIMDFNEAGETLVNISVLETTEDGKQVKNLFDEGIDIGVSQRAIGIQSYREDDKGSYYIVVDKIVRILGYDFCLLDSAAAGDRTALKLLDTTAVENIVNLKPIVDQTQEEDIPMDAKELAALLDKNNASLLASITTLTDTIQTAMSVNSDDVPPEITTSFTALKDGLAKLTDSKLSPDKKNAKLQSIAKDMQALVDVIVPKPAPVATEPTGVDESDNVVTAMTDSTTRLKLYVSNRQKAEADKAKGDKLGKYLLDKIAMLEQTDEVKTELTTGLASRVFDTEKDIDTAIDGLLKLIGLGIAAERQKAEGIKPRGTAVADIKVISAEHLKGAVALCDQLIGTGYIKGTVEDIVHAKNRKPQLKALLDTFDSMYGGNLQAEAALIARLTDATQTPADFQIPYTISRIVLEEVYADYIIEGITDFGPMAAKRDQIPITKYTREGGLAGTQRTYKPSTARINELKVGEFQPMAKGKLTTTWYPIDATASKLQAAFSDEFATLSRRFQNITGVAKGIANLISDVRRSLQQMVFADMRNSALAYQAVAFTYNGTGNGTDSIFTVIADHSISPADPLTVTVNNVGINEFEVSTTGAFFYVVDISLGKIHFVNADGTAHAVTNAHAIVVTGKYATNETRFSMTPGQGVEWEKHMNKLLFAVTNVAASHRQIRGYKPDMILGSEVSLNYTTQAQAYEAFGNRENFKAPSVNSEGNYGRLGNLASFGSDVWDNEFLLLTQRDATIFRIFEPLILKGPFETRTTTGQLSGGEEYYVYQEDSLKTPLQEKSSLITLIP